LEKAQDAQKAVQEAAKASTAALREQETAAKATAKALAEAQKAAFLAGSGGTPSGLLGAGIPQRIGGGFTVPSFGGFTLGGLTGPTGSVGLGKALSLDTAGFQAQTQIPTTQAGGFGNLGPQFFQDAAKAAGAAGALAGGDALGALALAGGPVGAGISTGLGVLQGIGEKGAGGVEDILSGLTDALLAALEALPEIIGEVIPDFIVALVSEFIPALVLAIPEIIKAALIDLPLALAKAIVDALGSILGGTPGGGGFLGIGDKNSGFLGIGNERGAGFGLGERDKALFGLINTSSDFVGRFQEGGHVDRTGLALVHRDEQVIPASGAGSFNATASRGRFTPGGGVNIDMSGALIGQNAGNEILRLLEDTIGPGGTGSTTIAGLAGRAGI
jgi:hypothetical protein